jgi:SAM-dependent methyltransferase
MTGFTAEWLSLREPADTRARDAGSSAAQKPTRLARGAAPPAAQKQAGAVAQDATLSARLTQLARRRTPPRFIDLACGTGANLRYLAPRIGGAQQWLLVDDDPALLEKVGAVAGCNVRTQRLDLVTQLDTLDFAADVIVTASALLDLVSERWLEQLVEQCRAKRCPALFALTYDGRMTLTPSDPDDEWIRQLVNRHQQSDKGFGGPALGPSACRRVRELFEDAGYEVLATRTDWHLLPKERLLQQMLLEGWATASMELAQAESARCRQWLARRLAHLATGASRITVGHEDVLAQPRLASNDAD